MEPFSKVLPAKGFWSFCGIGEPAIQFLEKNVFVAGRHPLLDIE
jgi:hypothetical protein